MWCKLKGLNSYSKKKKEVCVEIEVHPWLLHGDIVMLASPGGALGTARLRNGKTDAVFRCACEKHVSFPASEAVVLFWAAASAVGRFSVDVRAAPGSAKRPLKQNGRFSADQFFAVGLSIYWQDTSRLTAPGVLYLSLLVGRPGGFSLKKCLTEASGLAGKRTDGSSLCRWEFRCRECLAGPGIGVLMWRLRNRGIILQIKACARKSKSR